MQGGVRNYLGDQKEVKAPLKWQSGPDHPSTELAYITQAEKDLLINQDLHNSLKGGANRGPSGIMSLNGWGDASQGFGNNQSGQQSGGNYGGDSSYNANERPASTRTVTNPGGNVHVDTPVQVTANPTTVSPKDFVTQKYGGQGSSGFLSRLFSGGNKYGYKDVYTGGPKQGEFKPGGIGRFLAPVLGMFGGLPGKVASGIMNAGKYAKNFGEYPTLFGDKGYVTNKGWQDVGNKPGMDYYNNLGLGGTQPGTLDFDPNAQINPNVDTDALSRFGDIGQPNLNNLESIVASMDNDMMTDYFNNEKGFVDNLKTKFGNDVEEAKVTAKQKQQIANDLPQLNNIYSLKDLWDNAKTWDDRGSKGFWGVGVEEAEPMTKEEFNQELKDQGYKGKKYI